MAWRARRAVVLVNPRAGRGDPPALAARAAAALRAAGTAAEVLATAHPGHATELARSRAGNADLVVVVGGDGTLREALVGLGEEVRSCVLALVPAGNANVIARELGIPRDPSGAMALLAAGAPRAIDVGLADDGREARAFLALVGVGFDGIVTHGVDRVRRTAIGRWLYARGLADAIYALCALPALLRFAPQRFSLEADGAVVAAGAPTIVVANAATYAKGWSMTPDARLDSGRLHWMAARSAAPPRVLAHLWAASRRRPVGGRLATYGAAARLSLTADRPFRWQLDGDPMPPCASLGIAVLPAQARVLAPR
ncbi:MAG: diacylglycerol kinase family protein [Planctomycetota bacterium]